MNSAHSLRRAEEAGFTLIESLVALGILSMAATLLLGGLTITSRFARDMTASEGATSEVTAAQIILRQRIEGLRPVAFLSGSRPTMDLDGADRRFDFYGVPPQGDPEGGVQRYRLMLAGSGDLMLFRAPELSERIDLAAPEVVGWTPSRLISGVTSATFAYYGGTRADPARRWRTFWRDQSRAPELVRIRVAFAAGDPRRWNDLIVRPGATIDLACDPQRGGSCEGSRS